MSDHFVQLTIQSGELHPAFVCTAPGDAACRRSPDDFEDGARESWSAVRLDGDPPVGLWRVQVRRIPVPDTTNNESEGTA